MLGRKKIHISFLVCLLLLELLLLLAHLLLEFDLLLGRWLLLAQCHCHGCHLCGLCGLCGQRLLQRATSTNDWNDCSRNDVSLNRGLAHLIARASHQRVVFGTACGLSQADNSLSQS